MNFGIRFSSALTQQLSGLMQSKELPTKLPGPLIWITLVLLGDVGEWMCVKCKQGEWKQQLLVGAGGGRGGIASPVRAVGQEARLCSSRGSYLLGEGFGKISEIVPSARQGVWFFGLQSEQRWDADHLLGFLRERMVGKSLVFLLLCFLALVPEIPFLGRHPLLEAGHFQSLSSYPLIHQMKVLKGNCVGQRSCFGQCVGWSPKGQLVIVRALISTAPVGVSGAPYPDSAGHLDNVINGMSPLAVPTAHKSSS